MSTFPSNEHILADYLISFSLSNTVSQGGVLTVTLPFSDYGSLGTNVQCRL